MSEFVYLITVEAVYDHGTAGVFTSAAESLAYARPEELISAPNQGRQR